MRYRRLGRTGLKVSEIGLGALELGRDWGIPIEGDFGRPDERDAISLVRRALDLGINFIDTAPAYQISEERVGKALKGRRQDVYLATKVGEHYNDERGFWYDYGAAAVQSSIEQSLRRLQTDTIDLLQIHSASVEIIRQGEVLDVMQRFQQAGHIRFIGMSGDDEAALVAIENGSYDTVQVVYNIFNQHPRRTVFPRALEHDTGVIIMVPLGHGVITRKSEHLDEKEQARVRALDFLIQPDRSLAQAALQFVLAAEAVSTAIPGTRKVANLESNVAATEGKLSSDEIQRLETMEGNA
jgi:aryl-alcohol dehydrogenase-like predicted oxidoreductase